MNEKPIERGELQKLFDKFSYIQNQNEITVLGYFDKPHDIEKNRFNPNYRSLSIHHDIGNAVQEVQTVKLNLKIPSETRFTKQGDRLITNVPLFATGNGVEAVRAIDEKLSAGERQYVLCRGAVQMFSVQQKAATPAAIVDFVQGWIPEYFGSYDEQLAMRIFQILRVAPDRNGATLPMLNVWIHELQDGTNEAEKLEKEGTLVGINDASLTGLIYMPPSFKLLSNGPSGYIHFKVRVERHDVEGQVVPTAQYPKNGYDIINVIFQSPDVESDFKKLHQGYPVRVEGSLENYKFNKHLTMNPIERQELSELLSVAPYSDPIHKLSKFLWDANISIPIPTYNILARKIDADYENW